MHPSWVQSYLTISGMIGMINSVLSGSFAGVLLVLLAFPLWACTIVGGIVFLASVALHQLYQQGQWRRLERNPPVHFPSPSRA